MTTSACLALLLALAPATCRAAGDEAPPHQVADDGQADASRQTVVLEPGLDPRVVEGLQKGFAQAGDFPSSVRIVISPHRSPLSPMVRVYAHGGMDMFYLQEVPARIDELKWSVQGFSSLFSSTPKPAYDDFEALGKLYGELARLVAAMKQCGSRPCPS